MAIIQKNLLDLADFTRATPATGWVNGRLHEFGVNEPRIVTDPATGYSGLLLEPVAQTNLILNSKLEGGGENVAPDSWTISGVAGNSRPIDSLLVEGGIAYEFNASGERKYLNATFFVNANTVYTFSFLREVVEEILGNQTLVWIVGVPVGTTGQVRFAADNAPKPGKYSFSFTTGEESGSVTVRFGIGVESTSTGRVVLSAPQLVEGSYPGSYTPTGASQVTRAGDRNTIPLSGTVGSGQGSVFIDFMNYKFGSYSIALVANNPVEGYLLLCVRFGTQEGITYGIQVASLTGSKEFPDLGFEENKNHRLAVSWSGHSFVAFLDGAKVLESELTFEVPNVNEINLFGDNSIGIQSGAAGVVRKTSYYPERLPDAQLAALTELT